METFDDIETQNHDEHADDDETLSYVTPTKHELSLNGNDSLNTTKKKPWLVTHLSLTREDSPLLLDPSKPWKPSKPSRSSRKGHGPPCAAILCRLWKSYQKSIDDYPLITKSLTSAVLTASGEVISQLIVSFQTFDAKQMWEFFFLGLVLQAPVTHYYYVLLDRELPPTSNPWTWTTFVKLLIDQLLFAPSFLFAVFLFLDTLEGLGLKAMMLHLQKDFGMTLVTNWKLWVPATLINLALVHPPYRVLYNNIIFFVWSIILAMLLLPPNE
ncbi:unnamed protein product [Cylindrotheca closterium]|uniref:Peroxisomal membrane protein 2 n=1 Tax=Cylindrotheca closterium TaxID=2856 RepID=A0AAD2CP25_9STRA|nr:unnamed protein product [Cylindrotheca closterium]